MRFVDTSFWVAVQNKRDVHGDEALNLWRSKLGPLVTSNHVIGETWTFIKRKAGHPAALRFLNAATRSQRRLTIHRIDEDTEDEAWRWLRRHDERDYSFVDATSFALMRRLRIREALAFDGDFSAAGFVELRP